MTDYFLAFTDEVTFNSTKGAVPFEYIEEGDIGSDGWSLDVIGNARVITDWDGDGEPILTSIPGYLVNLRSSFDLPEHLEVYRVYPESPIRVWA